MRQVVLLVVLVGVIAVTASCRTPGRRDGSIELGIQVTVGGKQVHRSSTTREFGLVTYTHRVPSQ